MREISGITDIAGVLVGHATVDDFNRGVHTGVTAVIPAAGNLFRQKLIAGCAVCNGFGKSMGLVQIREKGVIETPIILTGVSSAGAMYDALFRRCMDECPEICCDAGSVNPVICECNDSYLNSARAASLGRCELDEAINSAGVNFSRGGVGAGRGMSCFSLKGGIGSASCKAGEFKVGALVNANFGVLENLILNGESVGRELSVKLAAKREQERGSIIIILATDAPLTSRQLTRLAKRAFVGVARTGSFVGDGSGDIAIAFSTATRVPEAAPDGGVLIIKSLHERYISELFKAAALATEAAIVDALLSAESLVGRDGHRRWALSELRVNR